MGNSPPESCRCTECNLNGKPVFGFGKPGGLVIVGEAPGRDELVQGRPFTGKSGKLLRETFREVNFDPDDAYYMNSVLCFSEGPPTAQATWACSDRMNDELVAANPRAILVLGGTALRTVLPGDSRRGITKVRGSIIEHPDLKVLCVPALHPAAILRNPTNFRMFARDVEKAVSLLDGNPNTTQAPELVLIKSGVELVEAIEELGTYSVVSVDIETTEISPLDGEITRIGLCADPAKVFIIYPAVWSSYYGLMNLKWFLERDEIMFTGHNAGQFDSKWLKHHFGMDFRPKVDTMLAFYCLDEQSSTYSLKNLAADYFQASTYKEDLVRSGGYKYYEDNSLDTYLGWDCHYQRRLHDRLVSSMDAEGVRRVHDDLLMPGALAFRDIELTGVKIDLKYLEEQSLKFSEEIDRLTAELRTELNNENFNPNSFMQVSGLLFDQLGLKDNSGRRSTEREVLEGMAHPIAKRIARIRMLYRTRSKDIDGLATQADDDERIRGDFRLNGTATGRLSSSSPNLQNVPVVMGPVIRNAFIATDDDWMLLSVDYSQLELRCAAWYSNDEYLMGAYQRGDDIHTMVASEIFHKPMSEITKMERYIAKYVDFGIIYGRGAKSLAEGELKCTVREAQAYITSFFERFSGLAKWLEEQRRKAFKLGYVETPFGRKRRFPLILDTNRAGIEHQAGNTPIQSMASDICLGSLIRLHRRLDPTIARILLTVHDSILFEVRRTQLAVTAATIRYEMEGNVPLEPRVPWRVDLEVGERWGSLEPYTTD